MFENVIQRRTRVLAKVIADDEAVSLAKAASTAVPPGQMAIRQKYTDPVTGNFSGGFDGAVQYLEELGYSNTAARFMAERAFGQCDTTTVGKSLDPIQLAKCWAVMNAAVARVEQLQKHIDGAVTVAKDIYEGDGRGITDYERKEECMNALGNQGYDLGEAEDICQKLTDEMSKSVIGKSLEPFEKEIIGRSILAKAMTDAGVVVRVPRDVIAKICPACGDKMAKANLKLLKVHLTKSDVELAKAIVAKFNPEQERDEHGRWRKISSSEVLPVGTDVRFNGKRGKVVSSGMVPASNGGGEVALHEVEVTHRDGPRGFGGGMKPVPVEKPFRQQVNYSFIHTQLPGGAPDKPADRTPDAWTERQRALGEAANGAKQAELGRIMARHELESDEFRTREEKAQEIYDRENVKKSDGAEHQTAEQREENGGFFTHCMGHIGQDYSTEDRKALCASLHHKYLGRWPVEDKSVAKAKDALGHGSNKRGTAVAADSNGNKVHSIKEVHEGIFSVTHSNTLNGNRKLNDLYRKVDGKWQTGENHPTGTYNSGLLREAPKHIADALDQHTGNAKVDLPSHREYQMDEAIGYVFNKLKNDHSEGLKQQVLSEVAQKFNMDSEDVVRVKQYFAEEYGWDLSTSDVGKAKDALGHGSNKHGEPSGEEKQPAMTAQGAINWAARQSGGTYQNQIRALEGLRDSGMSVPKDIKTINEAIGRLQQQGAKANTSPSYMSVTIRDEDGTIESVIQGRNTADMVSNLKDEDIDIGALKFDENGNATYQRVRNDSEKYSGIGGEFTVRPEGGVHVVTDKLGNTTVFADAAKASKYASDHATTDWEARRAAALSKVDQRPTEAERNQLIREKWNMDTQDTAARRTDNGFTKPQNVGIGKGLATIGLAQAVAKAGTSDGVKRAWETRRAGGASQPQVNPAHNPYQNEGDHPYGRGTGKFQRGEPVTSLKGLKNGDLLVRDDDATPVGARTPNTNVIRITNASDHAGMGRDIVSAEHYNHPDGAGSDAHSIWGHEVDGSGAKYFKAVPKAGKFDANNPDIRKSIGSALAVTTGAQMVAIGKMNAVDGSHRVGEPLQDKDGGKRRVGDAQVTGLSAQGQVDGGGNTGAANVDPEVTEDQLAQALAGNTAVLGVDVDTNVKLSGKDVGKTADCCAKCGDVMKSGTCAKCCGDDVRKTIADFANSSEPLAKTMTIDKPGGLGARIQRIVSTGGMGC